MDIESTFKLVVAGSRSFRDYEYMEQKLDLLLKDKAKTHKIIIISGTAKGADMLGEKYAENRNYEILRFPANWDRYGKRAGMVRNATMSRRADAVVVFWDGESRGTRNMMDIALDQGKALRVFKY